VRERERERERERWSERKIKEGGKICYEEKNVRLSDISIGHFILLS